MAVKEINFKEFKEKRDLLDPLLSQCLSPLEEKEGARYYWSEKDQYGFAIEDNGYLFSVFCLKRGNGKKLVSQAILKGAKTLDCLGEHLKNLYESAGFNLSFQAPWDDELAPKNWRYEKWGRPNYYEMTLS